MGDFNVSNVLEYESAHLYARLQLVMRRTNLCVIPNDC